MSAAVPQTADEAAPPSYGDAVKEEPNSAQQVQPQPGQLPPGYAYQQQPVQQVVYMVPAPVLQQQAVVKPDYPAPHDYLLLSFAVLGICTLLNISSMAIGIPALVFAVLSNLAKNSNNYVKASKYSRMAVYLIVINIVYTLLWAILITGLVIGMHCRNSFNSCN